MRYRIVHKTVYRYSDNVSVCQNEAYLLPRDTSRQHCVHSRLAILPIPALVSERIDFFGNRVSYFAVQQPHSVLNVTSTSIVETRPGPEIPESPPWEQIRDALSDDISASGIEARGLVLNSAFAQPEPAIVEFAQSSFKPQCSLLEAVHDLSSRIFHEFKYDPHFTTIITPLAEVLEHRRGVCQDFAHLAIACVRSMGLAARYVSGYLETIPPPGQPKLQGADASHAWFSVYLPEHGWFDFDPTNNQTLSEQYITTAWGLDYGDVAPLKGVIIGGGEHQLEVSVDVTRV
jgi:transglutaminase-like putative cysteine protease